MSSAPSSLHSTQAILNHQPMTPPSPQDNHGYGYTFTKLMINTCNANMLTNLARPETNDSNATSHTLDGYVQHINEKKNLSPKTLKAALVYFICEADLPLSITETSASRALLELCNPDVTDILVRRASLTAHLTNLYFYHQESICNYLLRNEINVSFTMDAWTSPNITAYLAVTAHYIDTDFKLISIIIGLTEIKGKPSVPFIVSSNKGSNLSLFRKPFGCVTGNPIYECASSI
ncbi:hypothetical protein O181_109373 [Austropuccinia psidii MF-1]|uniref:Uncharacterized protein n=1 Tax=Austropuccinia psidii MF-1 TaxID=1389203 RepID=A0A9Q3PPS2_9BASI|nr:hypothetical protein [Austropuccinia psidii MF-1]